MNNLPQIKREGANNLEVKENQITKLVKIDPSFFRNSLSFSQKAWSATVGFIWPECKWVQAKDSRDQEIGFIYLKTFKQALKQALPKSDKLTKAMDNFENIDGLLNDTPRSPLLTPSSRDSFPSSQSASPSRTPSPSPSRTPSPLKPSVPLAVTPKNSTVAKPQAQRAATTRPQWAIKAEQAAYSNLAAFLQKYGTLESSFQATATDKHSGALFEKAFEAACDTVGTKFLENKGSAMGSFVLKGRPATGKDAELLATEFKVLRDAYIHSLLQ